METKVTGRLENWGHDPYGRSILWGNLYDDIHGRWEDGMHVHTSTIEGLDDMDLKEGDIVKTRNSTYLLGKRVKEL